MEIMSCVALAGVSSYSEVCLDSLVMHQCVTSVTLVLSSVATSYKKLQPRW